jgi:hypothetical protein
MPTSPLTGPARLAFLSALPAVLFTTDKLGAPVEPVSAPALRYTFTNSSSTSRSSREQVNLAGVGFVRGDDVRIELTAGGKQFFAEKGDYLLVRGREGNITVVDVDRRRYFELPTADLHLGLAGMTTAVQAMVKLEVSNLSTRSEKVGAGPAIAGYPTTQYRVSQQYTLSMTAMGMKTAEKVTATTDFFVAPAVMKEIVNPFMQIRIDAAEMIGGGSTGLGEIVRQVVAEQEKWFTGTPVKTVTRSTSVDDKGKETVSTSTNEITSLSRVDVPASRFTIPEGYALVDNPLATLATGNAAKGDAPKGDDKGIPGGKLATEVGDAAKDGAKQGIKDEVRRTTRDAVTKKVRGILRKP